jgi:hypothetical protein
MPIVDIDITKSVIEKVLNRRVHPNLTIVVPENGASYTPRLVLTNEHLDVEISWSTLLLDGSLKVFLDKVDVTSKFWVDNDELKATGSLPMPKLGAHTLEASGQFLSNLLPLQIAQLNATSGFTIHLRS